MNRKKLAVCLAVACVTSSAFADDVPFLSNRRITDQGVMNLGTRTGSEIGVSAAFYKYQEPDIGVREQGARGAIDYSGTYHFKNNAFVRAELKYSNGPGHYTSSSGTKTNPNFYYEARALIGYDTNMRSFDLSMFTGFGYRYLDDNTTGLTSTGAAGYNRQSQYFYIPVGIIHRMHLASPSDRLTSTFEFDYLVYGHEKSSLSDLVGGQGITQFDDANSSQRHGYALRVSSMYETRHWSIGPYFTYWSVHQSSVSTLNIVQDGFHFTEQVVEPRNNTIEAGIRAAVRF
jgi:hypothetical protein